MQITASKRQPPWKARKSVLSVEATIIALLIAVAGFVVASRRRDRVSAPLFLPYLAWVAFATTLNSSILLMN
ncbi:MULTISPECIES: tryptophan-rich sensory protein [Ensifer]|uniref:tryptophan-rich sensory protein n=1 Tax=Ensifer TaxID=106591 RepID=UPI0009F4BFD7|nr:TspO/MBR family protein [Ensifer adhaerens]